MSYLIKQKGTIPLVRVMTHSVIFDSLLTIYPLIIELHTLSFTCIIILPLLYEGLIISIVTKPKISKSEV